MSYEVVLTPNFKKEAKRISRKYPSLKSDLAEIFTKLKDNPKLGVFLGNGVRKIRLSIASKGKGKFGGARIISYFKVEKTILLLSIYDKGDKETISTKEIIELIKRFS